MSKAIYLLQNDGRIIDMREQPFDSEDILQKLIAQYPHMVSSDQPSETNAPKFALVSREMGLATEEDGGKRWAIDHLLIDQNGILTVVEVKRSTDTRIRREVVGQMLDYAANAVVYLPVETIRSNFEKNCEDAEQIISDLLDEDSELDYEMYWETVRTNLQAGKLRLLFVSDEIPNELRVIIEFLNKNMPYIDVMGIEIKQYVDTNSGFTTLVPRQIGQTADAQRVKATSSRRTHGIGDIKESVQVSLSDGTYKIDQHERYTIRIYNIDTQVEEKALPMLKRINAELELGIEEYYGNGTPRNTRQLGDWVVKELKRQAKGVL